MQGMLGKRGEYFHRILARDPCIRHTEHYTNKAWKGEEENPPPRLLCSGRVKNNDFVEINRKPSQEFRGCTITVGLIL